MPYYGYYGGGGSSSSIVQQLPSGAVGVWVAGNYSASTNTIPNTITNGSLDHNILLAPRRQFNGSLFWTNGVGAATIVDSAATAPDGSGDASTFVSAASTNWILETGTGMQSGGQPALNTLATLTVGNTYTFAGSVKSLSGGSQSFKFGELRSNVFVAETATTSWGRFAVTFTANVAGTVLQFVTPDGVAAANFAICDFQLFAGSSDLNANALTAPPNAVANADIVLSNDGNSVVTGGKMSFGSRGLIQFRTARTPTAFTVIYAVNHGGSPSSANLDAVLSTLSITSFSSGYQNFSIGSCINDVGTLYSNINLDKTPSLFGTVNAFGDLWRGYNSGIFVGAHRYDGSTASSFLNGVKLYNNVVSASPPTFAELAALWSYNPVQESSYEFRLLAYYERSLTDSEISAQAYNYIASNFSLQTPRTVIFLGSSITWGQLAESYAYLTAVNLVPGSFGANWGVSGYNLGNISAGASQIDTTIAASAPSQEYVLICEIGVNDLGVGNPYSGNPNGFTTAYAAFLDARKTAAAVAGKTLKIIVHTIMARLDQSDGGTQFLSDRAVVNPTLLSWVGTHCNASADWASDATMGTNTAPNNTTYFGDKVHPTEAGYTLLEPYTRNAINSV